MYGLPPAQYTREWNSKDAINPDIIKVLECDFYEAREQTTEFSQQFDCNNLIDTCRKTFNYAQAKIQYKEDGRHQKIKLPARLVADRRGDCKSFALFCCSVLSHYAPVAFRYASYDGDETPTHVYCLVKQPNGKVIIVDACYDEFNAQADYTFKYDHWMPMTISTLRDNKRTGVPNMALAQGLYEERKKYTRNTSVHKALTARIAQLMGIKGRMGTPVTGNVAIPQLLNRNTGGTTETGVVITPAIIQSNPLTYQTAIDWYNMVKWSQGQGLDEFNNISWLGSYTAPNGIAYTGTGTTQMYQTALTGLASMPPKNWLKTPDPLLAAQAAAGGLKPNTESSAIKFLVNTAGTVVDAVTGTPLGTEAAGAVNNAAGGGTIPTGSTGTYTPSTGTVTVTPPSTGISGTQILLYLALAFAGYKLIENS